MMERKAHQTHTDLLDPDGEPNAWRFCVPAFIGSAFFGLFLESPNRVRPNPKTELPPLRSGTLTFVRHGDEVFALTCGHVIDELDRANRQEKANLDALCGADIPFPPEVQHRFLFPAGAVSLDLNIKFQRCPDLTLDLAFGWVPPDLFTALQRQVIDIGAGRELPDVWPAEAGALACGYPENNRPIHDYATHLGSFGIKSATLRTWVERPMGRQFWMRGELGADAAKDIDVLSGMSGGPILVTCDEHWGLAGIVSGGSDLNIFAKQEGSLYSGPAIQLQSEVFTLAELRLWLSATRGVRSDRPTHHIGLHSAAGR